jgi:hypothetical protein
VVLNNLRAFDAFFAKDRSTAGWVQQRAMDQHKELARERLNVERQQLAIRQRKERF